MRSAAEAADPGAASAAAPLPAEVFRRLADGHFHSGEELARGFGVTRSAVWKATAILRELGVEILAVRNRGYRLRSPCAPLDVQRILAALPLEYRERIVELESAWSIRSTNDVLLARPAPLPGSARVMLAEHQTHGRGRRGRAWLAPPGGALCLSLAWTFAEVPRDLSALSLVVGVCVQRGLARLEGRNITLKWPNDVLCGHRKLGGILIELRVEAAGPATVVIGIGLNCALSPELRAAIAATGLPAADLTDAGISPLSRNEVAASVLGECLAGLRAFERQGAPSFLEEWRQLDALRGREITVNLADAAHRGVARGVDLSGALLLETPAGLSRHISGDVSVRFEP